MKTSSKIGKALAIIIMLMACGVLAEECKKSTSNLIISHELKTEKNLVCIARNNKEVVILVYRNSLEDIPISRNVTLLDEADIAEEAVRLESSGDGFKIYFEYPNNVYLVGFDVDAKHVTGSYTLIKLNAVASGAPPQQMSLVVAPKKLAGLSFETLTKGQIFDQSMLGLEQPFSTVITAQKTQVYYSPSASSFSEMNLVQGDSVNVIDFKDGWIKIQYKTLNYLENSGWILLADIL